MNAALQAHDAVSAQRAYVHAGACAGSAPPQSFKMTVVADGQLAGANTLLLGAGIHHSF